MGLRDRRWSMAFQGQVFSTITFSCLVHNPSVIKCLQTICCRRQGHSQFRPKPGTGINTEILEPTSQPTVWSEGQDTSRGWSQRQEQNKLPRGRNQSQDMIQGLGARAKMQAKGQEQLPGAWINNKLQSFNSWRPNADTTLTPSN